MIKVNNVIKEMETLAPICLKEDFDNVGLMVGDRNKIGRATRLNSSHEIPSRMPSSA